MKLFVLGATGGTGQLLVERAVHAHQVTVFSRNPEKLTVKDDRLRIVKGSMLDEIALADAMAGHDAVMFLIEPTSKGETTLRTDGARTTVGAMTKTGVRRLVALSGLGAGVTRQHRGFFFDKVTAAVTLRHTLKDQNGLEAAIRRSDLDWIVVRPGEMSSEPGSTKWIISFDGSGISGNVSREDVVRFMLEQLVGDEYIRKPAAIGYDIP